MKILGSLLFFDGEETDERERAPVVLFGEKMHAVKITVKSQGRDLSGVENLELVSYGTMTEKNSKWYVRYQESETTGMAGTMTTIKWDLQRVIVLRNGSVEHRQEFFPGLHVDSLYRTPELEIPMSTRTKSVDIKQLFDGSWQLLIAYELFYFQTESKQMDLRITIEEDKQRGYKGCADSEH